MKAQWQLINIETNNAVTVGEELILVNQMKSYFFKGSHLSWDDVLFLFGDPVKDEFEQEVERMVGKIKFT